MTFSDLLRMGVKNLSRRKARTALTVTGVVIGTISIVVMISIGLGMNHSFQSQVMELGSLTTVTVRKDAAVYDKDGQYVDSRKQTMDNRLLAQIKQIPHVKVATPVITRSATLNSGKYQCYIQINAMDIECLKEFGLPALTYGILPSKENKNVLLLGSDILGQFGNPRSRNWEQKQMDLSKDRMKLSFTGEYQIAPDKKEKMIPWRDFGVLEKSNGEYDWSVYMDLDGFQSYYKEYIKLLKPEDKRRAQKALRNYDEIKINVDNIKNVEKVQKAITDLGFASESLTMFLKPMQQTSNMLQLVLGGVGAVAMLVSAISIANTMVMSIYERTKEIGVMKVLGCLVSDIKKLFLFEAAMIGLLGGVIGVLCSYLASFCINRFGAPVFSALMSNSMGLGDAQTKFSIIPFWLPILAAGFATLIGILSGYYPANRATRISAIEAMKSEG